MRLPPARCPKADKTGCHLDRGGGVPHSSLVRASPRLGYLVPILHASHHAVLSWYKYTQASSISPSLPSDIPHPCISRLQDLDIDSIHIASKQLPVPHQTLTSRHSVQLHLVIIVHSFAPSWDTSLCHVFMTGVSAQTSTWAPVCPLLSKLGFLLSCCYMLGSFRQGIHSTKKRRPP